LRASVPQPLAPLPVLHTSSALQQLLKSGTTCDKLVLRSKLDVADARARPFQQLAGIIEGGSAKEPE
jgi:hypothetical protein